jgi:hypothetical protein
MLVVSGNAKADGSWVNGERKGLLKDYEAPGMDGWFLLTEGLQTWQSINSAL